MHLLAEESARREGLLPVPGDPGLPLLGSTLEFLTGTYAHDRSRYDRLGPVHWVRLFGQTGVNALGPDAVAEVLRNKDRAFANGPGWNFFIGPFFKRGIMLLDFAEHHQNRRIMQQAFTRDRLVGYLASMQPIIDGGLSDWDASERFRVYPAMKQLTLDVATRTFLGADLGAEADRINHAFADLVRAGTAILRFPVPRLRWSRGLAARAVLEEYFYRQIPAARAEERDDLLSALCHARGEEGERFTDEDVVNHMIFLLMAAHDTSTITLTTMAYELARHSEWQERCRAESAELPRDLSYADLDRLTSLDLVMKESLRLVTPLPGMIRKTVKDTELLGYFLPKNTYVAVGNLFTHHMHEWWTDPETFDPERFAEPRREDKGHQYAYLPFGGGAHKCIGMYFGGMEVKATMHRLLLDFEWSVGRGYEMPVDWTSLPRPRDGLPVRLVRR